jgi:hypothetical protein
MPLIRALTLAFLLCALPGTAGARVAVVAPFGGLGVPATEAGKVQRWVEAALSGVPGSRWLAPGRLAKLLRSSPRYVGCEAEPRCLGGLARQLGAEWVVSGEVGSLGGGFMVYLRLHDGQGRTLRTVNGVLEPDREGLRDTARGLAYRLLQPEKYSGSLEVSVDVPNAWIYLDGKRVGRSPSPRIDDLGVGPHALRVTHEAYRDFVHFINVGFGETTTVAVKLTAYPVHTEQMPLVEYTDRTLTDRELPWYRRWWALTAFGAVLLAGTATTAAILLQRSAHHDAQITVHP